MPVRACCLSVSFLELHHPGSKESQLWRNQALGTRAALTLLTPKQLRPLWSHSRKSGFPRKSTGTASTVRATNTFWTCACGGKGEDREEDGWHTVNTALECYF